MASPTLNYQTLATILSIAQSDASLMYRDVPDLLDHIQYIINDSVRECTYLSKTPVDILETLMNCERGIINAYNKHRLGKEPDSAASILDIEVFHPVRLAAQTMGFSLREPLPLRQYQKALPLRKSRPATEKGQYQKFADAPSMNLDFPRGNFTVAEVLAYLPEWIKTWDMIDRMVSNGATCATMTHMLNTMRVMPRGEITPNSMLKVMRGSVEKRVAALRKTTDSSSKEELKRWEDWSVGRHEVPDDWDNTDMTVFGFQPPRITHPRSGKKATAVNAIPTAVSFSDLKNGVKQMPQGYDALDLTRCIEYHVAHPNEEWWFPQDFQKLVQHLGGPLPVRPENHDRAVFARWTEHLREKHKAVQTQRRRGSTKSAQAHNTRATHRQVESSDTAQSNPRSQFRSTRSNSSRAAKLRSPDTMDTDEDVDFERLDVHSDSDGNTDDEE